MVPGANLFAWIVLLGFVPVAMVLFRALRPAPAAAVAALAGTLFLPETLALDLPALPPLDKPALTYLGILLGVLTSNAAPLIRARPGGLPDVFILTLLIGNLVTALTNGDPVATPVDQHVRLTFYDGLSMVARDALEFGVPYFCGRALFRTGRDLRVLAYAMVGMGLVYCVLALVEIRLSPQLHRWLYGYHVEIWHFVLRWGGFRPRVFLRSGMAVGLFLTAAGILAVALARGRTVPQPWRPAAWPAAGFLGGMVVLCKSTAAIVYAGVLLPLMALMPLRLVALAVVGMSVLVLGYPLARATGAFPTERLTELARSISVDRADSLAFRFENEDLLLSKALERPLFGWGIKSRPIVWDPVEEDQTTVDGFWIVQFGYRGFVGWASTFLLLLVPAWRLLRRMPQIRDRGDQLLGAALSLVVCLYAVDMLPNGFFTNLPVFLAGALWGVGSGMVAPPAAPPRPEPRPQARPGPRTQARPEPPTEGRPEPTPNLSRRMR